MLLKGQWLGLLGVAPGGPAQSWGGMVPGAPAGIWDMESTQKRALWTAFSPQPYDTLLHMWSLLTWHERLRTLTYKFYTGMKSPNHRLHRLLPCTREWQYNLCQAHNLLLVACRTEHVKQFYTMGSEGVRLTDCQNMMLVFCMTLCCVLLCTFYIISLLHVSSIMYIIQLLVANE